MAVRPSLIEVQRGQERGAQQPRPTPAAVYVVHRGQQKHDRRAAEMADEALAKRSDLVDYRLRTEPDAMLQAQA